MATCTDQIGNSIILDGIPKRIVSLVPSQTELLYALGLDECVVGITKFCVHPEQWFRSKKRIGGPKSVHIDQVKALQPDLIIANKEENYKTEVEALSAFCPVWTSDVATLPDALQMIAAIGAITGTADKALLMTAAIQGRFNNLPKLKTNPLTAYLIWQDPYMAAGSDTFIHHMMLQCGFDNIFKDQPRYPVTSIEYLQQCQLLLLSSEPFPFQQHHLQAIQQQLPATKIILVDGEMFSWYGSRLLQAPAYFESLRQFLVRSS